jgi:hypothetical protein
MTSESTAGDGMTFGTAAEVERQRAAQEREATREAVFTQLREEEQASTDEGRTDEGRTDGG